MHLCSAFKALDDGTKSWCFLLHNHGGAHLYYVDISHDSGSEQ